MNDRSIGLARFIFGSFRRGKCNSPWRRHSPQAAANWLLVPAILFLAGSVAKADQILTFNLVVPTTLLGGNVFSPPLQAYMPGHQGAPAFAKGTFSGFSGTISIDETKAMLAGASLSNGILTFTSTSQLQAANVVGGSFIFQATPASGSPLTTYTTPDVSNFSGGASANFPQLTGGQSPAPILYVSSSGIFLGKGSTLEIGASETTPGGAADFITWAYTSTANTLTLQRDGNPGAVIISGLTTAQYAGGADLTQHGLTANEEIASAVPEPTALIAVLGLCAVGGFGLIGRLWQSRGIAA